MIEMNVQIHDINALQKKFDKAPQMAIGKLSNAIKASIFEVEKQAVDRNFQFKWPRARRTGFLERSFAYGRYIHPSGLMASIGPTAMYSPFVYYGTSRGIKPNPYMERIAKAAEPHVQKHFENAINKIVEDLAI